MFQVTVNTPCAVPVLEVKRLSASSTAGSAPATARFRLSISDGIHFMPAMVATQLNPRVSNEEVNKDSNNIYEMSISCTAFKSNMV